jgi:hypothetical protein
MRIQIITVASLLLADLGIAAAQPAAAQAQVLFDQGIKLLDTGNFGEACAAFDASDKLEPAISTLLNRADCREKNNQLASAWGLFLDAERQTRNATDAPTQQLHLVAIDHAAKLEPRLSRLTVNVSAGVKIDGLSVRRGGDLIEPGAWNHPLPIDGGSYTVTTTAPGHDTWTTVIEVAPEGDSKTIDVVALKLSPVVIPAHRANDDDRHSRHVWSFVAGGAGIAAIATGVILGLDAKHKWDEANAHCDSHNVCDATGVSINNDARSVGNIGSVVGVVGLAATIAGVVLYVTAPAARSITEHATINVAPYSGDVSVAWTGHF